MPSPNEPIRVATLNMWGGSSPIERRLELMREGFTVARADVIALQEVRVVPGELPNTAETLARSLDMKFEYQSATESGGGDEGLAILSRFPIVSGGARELPHANPDERRILQWVTLETPDGPLVVANTHLNYRLTHGAIRENQVAFAESALAELTSPLPKIWMGDFNARPDSDEIRYLKGLRSMAGKRVSYQDAWERVRPQDSGYTWSRKNSFTEKLRWLEIDRRIDYVFVSPMHRDGRGTVLDCKILFDSPASDGCFASDHFGLIAEVQLGAESST